MFLDKHILSIFEARCVKNLSIFDPQIKKHYALKKSMYAIDTYMAKCNIELGVVVHTDYATDYLLSHFSLYEATSGIKTTDCNQR